MRTRWLAEKRNATGTITCRTIRLSIQRNVYPKTWSRVSLLCRLNRSWLQGGLCAMQVRNHKRAVVCRPLPLCLTLIRVMTVRRNNYLRHPRNRDIGSAVYTHFVGWHEGEKKKTLDKYKDSCESFCEVAYTASILAIVILTCNGRLQQRVLWSWYHRISISQVSHHSSRISRPANSDSLPYILSYFLFLFFSN